MTGIHKQWRSFIVFIGCLTIIFFGVYYINSRRLLHAQMQKVLYLAIDTPYKGKVILHYRCPDGERLTFSKNQSLVVVKNELIRLNTNIDSCQIGILNLQTISDSSNQNFFVSKNPRLLNIERVTDGNAETCNKSIIINIDSWHKEFE